MCIIYNVTNCKAPNASHVNTESFCTEHQLEGIEGTPTITTLRRHYGLIKVVDGVIHTNMYAEPYSRFEIKILRERFDKGDRKKSFWFASPDVRREALNYLKDIYY